MKNNFARNDIMKTFRDLVVWQKSMAFVTEMYAVTKFFPSEELFGLTSQLRRATVSIPSNIAEGYGRKSDRDFYRYLKISIASLYEVQTQLEIAHNLQFVTENQFTALYGRAREIERILSAFSKTVKNTIK